jgi:hypothetical protein
MPAWNRVTGVRLYTTVQNGVANVIAYTRERVDRLGWEPVQIGGWVAEALCQRAAYLEGIYLVWGRRHLPEHRIEVLSEFAFVRFGCHLFPRSSAIGLGRSITDRLPQPARCQYGFD